MGKHPLANRPPSTDLGRWAPRNGPVAPPHQRPPLPPPGEHIWVLLSWHIITAGQAAAVANTGAVTAAPSSLIARQVGCYSCHGQYADVVGKPCTASQVEPEPPEEPSPEPETPAHEVPVDPPTPPDAGPPVVELARPMSETALS